MFGLLIWSKNRAAQLDLLLSSIEKFCPNLFKINVLYKHDAEKFAEGYEKLKEYHQNVNYHYEQNLAQDTKAILAQYDYCCVSTDDTIFYSPFSITEKQMENIDIFSLRIGQNNKIQNPFNNEPQVPITKFADEGYTICWDSRFYPLHSNPGYLFGHDATIYSRRYLDLIQNLNFKSINELESYLILNCSNKINPYIRGFKQSKAVNIPGNNTSGVTQTDNSLPLNEINNKFLLGQRFDLNCLNNVKIVGAHQLLPLTMN